MIYYRMVLPLSYKRKSLQNDFLALMQADWTFHLQPLTSSIRKASLSACRSVISSLKEGFFTD